MPASRMMQHSPAMSRSNEPAALDVTAAAAPSPRLHRRRLLQLGVGAAAVLALAGTGAALWSPGWRGGRLSPSGRVLFRSVAQSVLEGSLPVEASARDRALTGLIERLEATVAGLPSATRGQLSQLLGLLQIGPARRWLCGLEAAWGDAAPHDIDRALTRMRSADDELRQQAYHALRDLLGASYFSDPATWSQLGYPGPTAI